MPAPRLLIVSFSEIASDARVLKQVKLFANQYDVTTFGYGVQPDPRVKHHSLAPELSAHRRRRADMILRRFRRMYWTMPAISNAQEVLRKEPEFDVVIANDIEAVGLALSLNPRYGVHADIHEYAPRQNEEVPVWKLFVAPYIRWLCKNYLTRADSVTTVGKGIADEYRKSFKVDAEVVTNATPAMELQPSPVGAPIRIVHSGAALRNRGLDKLVLAVIRCTADVRLDLYLMPNDLGLLDELKALAGTSERVTVHDPVAQSRLVELLNSYDVGIHVIPPVSFNNAWALPNKFFDYVQARLGLIIGPSPEMVSLLSEHHLGAVTRGFEIDDIVSVLDDLTPETVTAWKLNANSAAATLSAEQQVQVWERAIADLMRVGRGR